MDNPTSILRITILANPKQLPRALWFELLGDPSGSSALIGAEEFAKLVQRLPCFFGPAPSSSAGPDKEHPLFRSGCAAFVPGELMDAPATWPSALEKSVRWVSGQWYLAAPRKPNANQLASRSLALKLAQLVAADADNFEIEAIFRQDPTLSYHLLRLVNSPGIGVGRTITSFAQAIAILGRQHLRRWLNLLLFASQEGDSRATMLLAHSAFRAMRMELLEKARGGDRSSQDQAFMAGMFSMLGILFGIPLQEILKPLQVSKVVEAAILKHEGGLGHLLQLAGRLEEVSAPHLAGNADPMQAAELANCSSLLSELGIEVHALNRATLEACGWMLNVVNESRSA